MSGPRVRALGPECRDDGRAAKQGRKSGRALSQDVPAPPRKKRVALRWAAALAVAATFASLRAPAVQQHPIGSRVEGAGRGMVRSGALSRRHFRAAALQNLLLLKDAAYLRDRLGIKLAFLEDPMLEGMLAARYTKGVRAAINGQLVDKLKAEASSRQVQASDTIDKLKAKIRPTLDAGNPVADNSGSFFLGDPGGIFGRSTRPMEVGPTQAEILMEVRDQRLEAMLAQTLQHFMVMTGQNAMVPDGEDGLSPDSDMGFRTVENAWNKCKHDRKLVKASPQDVNEAFAVLDDRVYDEALHEPFVGATFELRTGDRASAMAQAVAHRRSGRHFFMELFRGAAPHRTVEGQELMDEPGVFDFLERPALPDLQRGRGQCFQKFGC
ncbi:hypothetical protein AK812_SmicGene6077 [Symbiodinium microadriaticum]|uniref:Uncharacterized protein n=1 Tax=Symbiodinium microadriaticum TaxID=2951 RepID=A0A1Q9ES42_SYMMI|nr:hypothetical protein AK812_SmicGene6077 [Symbiodinium microadriaticum]